MGLINAKNIQKAKGLLEKNRDKVGDVVGKATKQIDKATKGKSAGVTAKIEQAARKFSDADKPDADQPDAAEKPATKP